VHRIEWHRYINRQETTGQGTHAILNQRIPGRVMVLSDSLEKTIG